MRTTVRLVRYLAIVAAICVLLLFLSLSNAPAALNEHVSSFKSSYDWSSPSQSPSAPTADVKTINKPKSIQQLWQFWSQAFEDAKPNTPKIRLRSNAPNTPIANDDFGLRSAGSNRVINDESDIQGLTEAHASFLKVLDSRSEDNLGSDVFSGAGIVTVGGGEYFGPAVAGLHMLRKTGSTLPVEIFVADSSEYEKELCDNYLPKLGAKCLVLGDFLKTGHGVRAIERRTAIGSGSGSKRGDTFEVTHYQLKSLAMLFCSFANVLYLDSDSIPLLDPAVDLFPRAPYNTTGLVIWPDFWLASESPVFWEIAGLPDFPTGLPKSSSEAGQLLINKHTHLKTLLLANYYNIYGPNYYYPLLSQGALGQGDKETFLAAATVLKEPWYRIHTPVDRLSRWANAEEKGSAMIQHHPSDDLEMWNTSHLRRDSDNKNNLTSESQAAPTVRAAFVHANTPKMNAGHLIDEGDLTDLLHPSQPLRLWGSKETQIAKLGSDLEKTIWEILVVTGCELHSSIQEWKERSNLCERLEEHFTRVFGGTSVVNGGSTLRWRNKWTAGDS